MTNHKKIITVVTVVVLGLLVLVNSLPVLAVDSSSLKTANDTAERFATNAGFEVGSTIATPEIVAGRIIGVVMGFLGVVFFILMVYGGWIWLLARGNDEKVTQAKDTIKHAIIGLLIVFAAYALSAFVVTSIVSITKGASG